MSMHVCSWVTKKWKPIGCENGRQVEQAASVWITGPHCCLKANVAGAYHFSKMKKSIQRTYYVFAIIWVSLMASVWQVYGECMEMLRGNLQAIAYLLSAPVPA